MPNTRLSIPLLSLVVALALSACGGGGGGGRLAGPGDGTNSAPTGSFLAPLGGALALPGDIITLSFTADDRDDAAAVTVLADADMDPSSRGDQTPLYGGVDTNGVRVDAQVLVPPTLPPGTYAVLLRVEDGRNAPFEILLPGNLLLYPAVAGVAAPRSNRYGVVGDTVVFSRGEAEDAAGVLNADGDTADGVFVALNAITGQLTQPAPSVSMDVTSVRRGQAQVLPSEGGTLAWRTREIDEGVNLNAANNQRGVPPIGGPDTDTLDSMVSFIVPNLSLTPVTNTWGGANVIVGREEGRLIVHYLEAGEGGGGPGGGSDLNADGDAADGVFGYIDTGVVGATNEYNQIVFCNIPAAAAASATLHTAGSQNMAFQISEATSAAGFDLNGDGDQTDTFLWLGDLLRGGGTGMPANFHGFAGTQQLPLVLPPAAIDPGAAFDVSPDGRVAYYIDESAHNLLPGGAAGNDRNGDGKIGMVPLLYDPTAVLETFLIGAAGPLDAPPGSGVMLFAGPHLFFTAMEAPRADPVAGVAVPGTNGDGDNGADLAILYWADHTQPAPLAQPLTVNFGGLITLSALSLDNGGSVTHLSPGWLAVLVNEAANGAQDINGSGVVDMAYLLVDATAQPAPLVYNPGIVTSAAGSIPLAGNSGMNPSLGGPGVVVRLTEAQNGNLDGDGTANEIFLACISFATPTQFKLLDVGGDYCVVADDRIGVTAIETYTGQDYNGNGVVGDHVFRVLDFSGNVLEAGRTCSPLSVPATETGRLWAYLRDEAIEGRRLNADTDMSDLILGLWMP